MNISKINSSKLFSVGQAGLFISIIICYFLAPGLLKDGRGLSNYGIDERTIWIFLSGFFIAFIFTLLASFNLTKSRIRAHMFVLSIIFFLVAASTPLYKVNLSLQYIHQLISIILFVFEFYVVVWLTFFAPKIKYLKFLSFGFNVGIVLSILSFFSIIKMLSLAESVTGVFFGLIAYVWLKNSK